MAVTAAQRIKRIRAAAPPEARQRLIAQAAQDTVTLPYLLAAAQEAVTNAPAEAQELAALAVEIAAAGQNWTEAAKARRVAGQALRQMGRHEDALNALNAAADHAWQANDVRLAAQIQIGAIDSLGVLGRVDAAFALARRLERELRELGAEADAARALVNAGTLHYRRDDYAQAAECFDRALPLFPPEDVVSLARVQANYAGILTETNDFERGLDLFEQARQAFETAGLARHAAMVEANVGWLRFVSGEYAAALAALTRAGRVFVEQGQEIEAAKCDADRAEIYRELHLDAEALECFDRALPVLQSAGLTYEQARAQVGAAASLARSGRYTEGYDTLQSAEEIFRALTNSVQTAYVHLVRAALLHAEGRNAEAAEAAQTAARGFARRHAGLAAEARFLILEAAPNTVSDAARELRVLGRTARRTARRWLACRVERALGNLARERGDTARALRHFRAGIETLESARALIPAEDLNVAFLQDKFAIYEDCVRVLLERGTARDVREALQVVERSRSRLLLERIQTAMPSASDTTPGERTELAALRAEISRAYRQMNALDDGTPRRFAGNTALTPDFVAQLEYTYRNTLRENDLLQNNPAASASASDALSVRRIQAALLPDETLIEYFVTGQTIGAFLVSRKALKVLRDVANLPAVLAATRRLRYQLQRMEMQADYVQGHARQMQAASESVLQELNALLLRPMCAFLTEKLVIVPFGPLHGLPFHAFHDGTQYAAEQYEILMTPSAAIFHAGRTKQNHSAVPPSSSLFGLGNSEPNIERVNEEMDCIAGLFPDAAIVRGEAATLAAFRANAPQCRFVHLATHALFRADNPLFSGLQCADGWLLARDLYTMRLHCELATLSACRTGAASVEAGDELFGLIRGFLSAGAQSVAASLWAADDAATAELMTRFYQHLVRGVSRAAALRAAQREVHSIYPHPYHWAAFTLTGER